jgi:hypothetical protein
MAFAYPPAAAGGCTDGEGAAALAERLLESERDVRNLCGVRRGLAFTSTVGSTSTMSTTSSSKAPYLTRARESQVRERAPKLTGMKNDLHRKEPPWGNAKNLQQGPGNIMMCQCWGLSDADHQHCYTLQHFSQSLKVPI